MGLTEYREKRNFQVTKEPRGDQHKDTSGFLFVVQKHDATHLHYDFRLELGGVLKSWAVPKGPSLNPADKRLAVEVEDHPREYGSFKGTIPQNEYGGGTVLLWDTGTWQPAGNPRLDLERGRLKFTLHGKKLHGEWMLVRRGGRTSGDDERTWFLIKSRDEFASERSVIDEEPRSVVSGRDLEEIAKQRGSVWSSQTGQAKAKKAASRPRSSSPARASRKSVQTSEEAVSKSSRRSDKRASGGRSPQYDRLEAAVRTLGIPQTKFPASIDVQLATLAAEPPQGEDWIHEIKFDGYRVVCCREGETVRMWTRNGKDWTHRFPDVTTAAEQLPVDNAVLDGEIVILEADGTTRFQSLQQAFQEPGADFVYYAFDLLYLNGCSTMELPLEIRKQLLREVLPVADHGVIRYCDHVVGNGPEFFKNAARLKLEGIVSKRLGRPYAPGRSKDWLKVKCSLSEEFVIGGYTRPGGSRTKLGALLLGYYSPDGRLIYAGRVGTGFSTAALTDLHARLTKNVRTTTPFADMKVTAGEARIITWTKPLLVAQVRFSEWTEEGLLRHPAFLGLREDKQPKDVLRDPVVQSATAPSDSRGAGAKKKVDKNAVSRAAGSRKSAAADSKRRTVSPRTPRSKTRLARKRPS